jgi:hypothetical protein
MFIDNMDKKIQEYQRDGKNPSDLFDPKNKDFLGSDDALKGFEPDPKAKVVGEPPPAQASPGITSLSKDQLIQGVKTGQINYDIGVAEAVRRGLIPAPTEAPIR